MPLAFSTIPKACGFEDATRFPSILLGGSLIPIVVYWDGDGFPQAKHVLTLLFVLNGNGLIIELNPRTKKKQSQFNLKLDVRFVNLAVEHCSHRRN